MRPYFFPLLILILFLASSVFLTLREEALLQEADQHLVVIGYQEPRAENDSRFFIRHEAELPRTVAIEYHYENGEPVNDTVTLAPKETRVFTPAVPPLSITVRYQTEANQEQSLTLYKK